MTDIELDITDLRTVAAYAAGSAEKALIIFERACPSDPRPGEAIAAARAFADGGKRVAALRDTAWAALKAAQDAGDPAACEAARAAMSAPSAAFLHPLARSTQVRHILGAAAHAARAAELAAGDDLAAGDVFVEAAACEATPAVVDILCRYPPAPRGGGRTGELLRLLDMKLRGKRREGGAT